jgi:hypothetical protein
MTYRFPLVCAVLLPLLLLGCKISDNTEDLKHNVLVGMVCGVLSVLLIVARAGINITSKDDVLKLLTLIACAVVIALYIA